jgi:Flp pilus assembly pilin Flp
MAKKVLLASLTDTQTMILYLTTQRLAATDIAARLHLTKNEVDTQFSLALRKLKPGALRALFAHIVDEANFPHLEAVRNVKSPAESLASQVANNDGNGEKPMKKLLRKVWSDDQGQDIAEYAVMLAVILVIVVGMIRLVGGKANNVFSATASAIGG